MNRDEYRARLSFCDMTGTDVIRMLEEKGIRCDKQRLAHALSGERKASLDRILQAADEVTLLKTRHLKAETERRVSEELGGMGIKGRVEVVIPAPYLIPIKLDGELFGLYDRRTGRMM